MLPLPDVLGRVFRGYRISTGSTMTGLADAFRSFWYFGWVKFFLIGFLLKKIWNAAQSGSLGGQLLYMLLIVKTMHVITHNTHWFFSPWVHISIFLFPALIWARQRSISAAKRNLLRQYGVRR